MRNLVYNESSYRADNYKCSFMPFLSWDICNRYGYYNDRNSFRGKYYQEGFLARYGTYYYQL